MHNVYMVEPSELCHKPVSVRMDILDLGAKQVQYHQLHSQPSK